MKIGVLTLTLSTNYGGILQAYALQTVLARMGHDVWLIEKKWKSIRLPLRKAPSIYGKRIWRRLMGESFPILYEQKVNKEYPIVKQYTDKFINKYIKRYIIEDYSDIKENDFDVIIVGSDQVWRVRYFPKKEYAFLDFAEKWNIKRIAYAASFGTDEWEYTLDKSEKCGQLLRMFNAVSVREDSAVDLCRVHFGVAAQHILDPTMLLSPKDYMALVEATETSPITGSLLCYILDETPEKTAFIEKVAKEKGLVPFRANSKVENRLAPLSERIQPPVEQWLKGFCQAQFVITDSFHACVFSILFNKPFIAIGNSSRGMTRFTSLLKMFGLQNQLITSLNEYKGHDKIDWHTVQTILDDKKIDAIKFLQDSLNS